MTNSTSAAAASTNYRKEFVQFLFSLCVVQIAVFFAGVVTIDPLWSIDKAAVISHLILALIVVWTSWFGWRKSLERNVLQEGNPFGRAAVLALVDILLVIIYFMLIRSADIVDINHAKSSQLGASLESPTPHREARLIFVLFVSYLVWDVISKMPCSWGGPAATWKWPWPSLVCAILSLGLAGLTRRIHKDGMLWATVLYDGALVGVVLLFRTCKEFQSACKEFQSAGKEFQSAGRNQSSVLACWLMASMILFVLVILFTVAALICVAMEMS